MKHPDAYQTVAKAVRMEYDSEKDLVYLVFEVLDEKFKQEIKAAWAEDIELKLIGKNLVKK